MISGKTLIDWGFRPGKWFPEAIAKATELFEDGKGEDVIKEALRALEPKAPPARSMVEPRDFLVYGEHDQNTLDQMRTCMSFDDAAAGVLCADGHLGYAHPIGGVVGYTNHISVSGVGFDIAFGNLAVRLDARAADLRPHMATIMKDIAAAVSFGMGRVNSERVDHDLFDSPLWGDAEVGQLKDMARNQLGTVGGGNHYVDVFEDDDEGFAWSELRLVAQFAQHLKTISHSRAGWDYDMSREERAGEIILEKQALAAARAIWRDNPDQHDELRQAFAAVQPLATLKEIEAAL